MEHAVPIVAIVDDDEAVRRALRRLVLSLSHQPQTFASGEEFLDALKDFAPDCVLLDLHMPGLKGLDVIERLRSDDSRVPAIIITGYDETGMREKCLKAGASAYLVKPVERVVMARAIEDAIAPSA